MWSAPQSFLFKFMRCFALKFCCWIIAESFPPIDCHSRTHHPPHKKPRQLLITFHFKLRRPSSSGWLYSALCSKWVAAQSWRVDYTRPSGKNTQVCRCRFSNVYFCFRYRVGADGCYPFRCSKWEPNYFIIFSWRILCADVPCYACVAMNHHNEWSNQKCQWYASE